VARYWAKWIRIVLLGPPWLGAAALSVYFMVTRVETYGLVVHLAPALTIALVIFVLSPFLPKPFRERRPSQCLNDYLLVATVLFVFLVLGHGLFKAAGGVVATAILLGCLAFFGRIFLRWVKDITTSSKSRGRERSTSAARMGMVVGDRKATARLGSSFPPLIVPPSCRPTDLGQTPSRP